MESPSRLERLSAHTDDVLTFQRSLDFARLVKSLVRCDNDPFAAIDDFAARYPRAVNRDAIVRHKAAIAAGSLTDTAFAPIAPVEITAGFLQAVRARSLLGRLPTRRVPFRVAVPVQNTGPAFTWTGEGKAIPVRSASFATASLDVAKAAGIIALTAELVRSEDPSSDALIRDDLARGVAAFTDQQFLDPALTAVASQNPASITNGAPSAAASGATETNARTDIKALLSAFLAANADVEQPVLAMTPATAVAVATALNVETLGATGGSLFGMSVLTSAAVGPQIVALDPEQILVAEADAIAIDAARHTLLQMVDVPTDPATSAVVYDSLWQRNWVGLKVTRAITWQRGRVSGVRALSGVAYV